MENNLIRLTGLWINKSKDGTQYISGMLNSNIKVMVFKNKNKRPDSKDPDYSLCLAPVDAKEETAKEESGLDF